MKILLISSYLPFPLLSGGQVRLFNLIEQLSKKHEITLICEKRPYQDAKDIAELEKICKEVITVDRGKQWSLTNIIKAGFSSNSFLLTGHTNSIFQQKIKEVLSKNSFDAIHVETYYVMQNLLESGIMDQSSGKVPIVLVEHNVEYQVYEKFMKRALFFLRPILQIDIAKIKREEEFFWKKADALVAVSREEQDVMATSGCKSFLVSNGVNTKKFIFKNTQEKVGDKEKRILFMGDFTWIQNQDTVKFILKEIWPKVKEIGNREQESGNVKLWIVGRKIPNSIQRLTKDSDVLFDETSSNLPTEKIFHAASVLLAPIRVGGGTSYKILESMSSGTPVVTMQLSADALGAQDGKDCLVGKDAEELAAKTVQLLQDNKLCQTVSKNGRELVEKNYTWEEIGKKLEEVYKIVVSDK